jgi:hypothetical protein
MHFPSFILLLTLFSTSEAVANGQHHRRHHPKRKLCDAPSARLGFGSSLSPIHAISRIMPFQVLRA